jgi:hypothetical protein
MDSIRLFKNRISGRPERERERERERGKKKKKIFLAHKIFGISQVTELQTAP